MSIFHGVFWGYIEKWGNKVISLLVFIVLARLLEPEDFGLVVFARLFIDYLEMLAGQGLDATIIQREKVTDTDLSTAFWINIVLSLCLVIGIYTASPFIESLFSREGIAGILRALIFVVVLNALSRIQVAILLREQKFKELSLRGLLMALAGGSVGVYAAYQGYGVWSMVFQQIASGLVAVVVLWAASTWRPSFSFSFSAAKEMYGFATKIIIDYHVSFFSKRLDELLIVTFLGVTQLGIYSVAKRLLDVLVEMIYSTINKVLMPLFSAKQKNIGFIINGASKTSLTVAAFSFPLFLGAACVSDELISVLFTSKWDDAASTFRILIISGVFLLMPHIVHPIFYSIGRPGLSLKLNVIRAGASVLLIVLAYPYGLNGIATAVLLSHIIGAVFDTRYLNSLVEGGAKLVMFGQMRYLSSCLPMILFIIGLNSLDTLNLTTEYSLAVKVIAGILVYGMTLFLSNDLLFKTVLSKTKLLLSFKKAE